MPTRRRPVDADVAVEHTGRRERHRSARLAAVGIAATAILALVGGLVALDRLDDPGDPGSTAPATPASTSPVPQASEVALQIGVYDLLTIPDWYITGPEVVIYDDGRVYTAFRDARPMQGQLSQQQVQDLVSAATGLPATEQSGVTASDEWPTVVLVGDHAWNIYLSSADVYHTFLEVTGNAVRRAATEPWEPSAWLVDRGGSPLTCEVVASPDASARRTVPVYPHLVDRYPPGPLDCTTV